MFVFERKPSSCAHHRILLSILKLCILNHFSKMNFLVLLSVLLSLQVTHALVLPDIPEVNLKALEKYEIPVESQVAPELESALHFVHEPGRTHLPVPSTPAAEPKDKVIVEDGKIDPVPEKVDLKPVPVAAPVKVDEMKKDKLVLTPHEMGHNMFVSSDGKLAHVHWMKDVAEHVTPIMSKLKPFPYHSMSMRGRLGLLANPNIGQGLTRETETAQKIVLDRPSSSPMTSKLPLRPTATMKPGIAPSFPMMLTPMTSMSPMPMRRRSGMENNKGRWFLPWSSSYYDYYDPYYYDFDMYDFYDDPYYFW